MKWVGHAGPESHQSAQLWDFLGAIDGGRGVISKILRSLCRNPERRLCCPGAGGVGKGGVVGRGIQGSLARDQGTVG